jgi:asparagine synthase (glutamine-hydrolysing)
MCGIAAIFSYGPSAPPVDQAELLSIREAMPNRGPDGAGLWVSANKRIGLAHRRLAIIDLTEAGAQPLFTSDGSIAIVFNGEIYNFRELRKELEAKGYIFQSNSDTEVLLYLYREHGRDMVQYLRGMYAFAIYDERQRGLFLARDPFGIKPLYYSDNGNTIRVASQVKALLKGQIDTGPDPAGHVGFHLWGYLPEPYTLYKGIRSLPAGTSLSIDAEGHKVARNFFNVTDELTKASESRLKLTPEEVHERLRATLLDSIGHHLIADVPVGVFLSSGFDSTTLVALASEISIKQLHTVNLNFWEFKNSQYDESHLAELVAKRYGTIHHKICLTKEDIKIRNQDLLDSMDQPSIDGVNSYFVSKAAKDAGLKVMLSGLGGDELFGGYPSFNQIPLMVSMFSPFNAIPALGKGFRYISASILKKFTSPKYAGLLEYGGSYGGAYLLRRGLYMPWELPELLDGEMVRLGWEELKTISRLEQKTRGLKNNHLKVTALETTWYMRNQLLRDTDWASMAHSIEVRTPLVDIELFRETAALLSSTCVPTKVLMAGTPLKKLPEAITSRNKTGFAVPDGHWIKHVDKNRNRLMRAKGWAEQVYESTKITKKHILSLVPDAFGGYGGIALYNRDLLKALSSIPDVKKITVIPRSISNTLEDLPDKLIYIADSVGGKLRYILAVLQFTIKTPKIDLIVCGHINFLPLAFALRFWYRTPIILEIYGIDAWKPTRSHLTNYLAPRVDGIISISDFTKQKFLAWADYPEEKVFLLPNAIHAELYGVAPKSLALQSRYGLGGKVVLMTLGRLVSEERYKGFDEILNILPMLSQRIPNISYLIAGTGSDLQRLKEKANYLGVSERVVFTGMIREEEKADHYRLADVYVMPSRGEGFGFVLLEAMACGIPVVASKRDGGREAVREGELGELVDPDNVNETINAINVALARSSNKIPDGLLHFSFENFVQRTHRIISNLNWNRN